MVPPAGRAAVAVVGGGSVGASFLHHLVADCAKRGIGNFRVVVFEPQQRLGRGGAYADDLHSNLLNVTAGAMSVAGDDPAHFQRWLTRHGVSHFAGRTIEPSSFVSRPLFGQYLEAVCDDTLQQAQGLRIDIDHVRAAVLEVHRDGVDGCTLTTADGNSQRADRVVLSLGNLPSQAFPELRGLTGFWASPYPTDQLATHIGKDANVGVLGTSLSAVDAIMALLSSGHRGTITAVSRNGRLPAVRGLLNKPVHLRPGLKARLQACRDAGASLPMETLATWLQEEFAAVVGPGDEDWASLLGAAPDAMRFLTDEIRLAQSQPRQWQAFGNATNDCIDLLWQALSAADRQRFDRDIRPVWMARRVTFPLGNAQAMQAAMARGQLQVLGGFASVKSAGPGFELRRHRGDRNVDEAIQVQHVINATSFSTDAAAALMPLLRSLLDQGWARPDPFGGLALDFGTGCLLNHRGEPDPSVSVLGSMAAGTYFWTNSMDVNARLAMGQAARVVEHIVQQRRTATIS